ncbi:MAG: ATP phosphoribosyltransferase [Thiotrichales bacterium]|nr:ATP phosphoribosyltransferase [Thiotrichales bacterium]
MLTIALSKGRICDEATPLLARAGISLDEDPAGSRRLCIATSLEDVRVLVLRAQDVPTFVEHGAADLGIAGKDVLLEHCGGGLYEPLDLGIARCRLVLAERPDAKPGRSRPRVATKYVETTRRFFAGKGMQAEIIHLYGSMEIAPAVGLADCIVDLVDTGATLAANGLVVREEIASISSRLIVNKAAMKLSHRRVSSLVERIGCAVARAGGDRS